MPERTAAGSNQAPSHDGLRKFFTMGNGPRAAGPASNWNLAFLTPPTTRSANPDPPQPRPISQSLPSQAEQPAQPKPSGGFGEARRLELPPASGAPTSPKAPNAPQQQAQPQPQSPGFATAPTSAQRQAQRPHPDDLEFAGAVLGAAERDFQTLRQAMAVVDEFAKRYPRTAESQALKSRYRAAQSRHAATLAERTVLRPDTPVAAVMFSDSARVELQACLSGIADLEKLSAITRPVSGGNAKPAFFLSAIVKTGGFTFGQTRAQRLETARTQLAPLLGPCLTSLLAQGTVALTITDGPPAEPIALRIEAAPGAAIFDRKTGGQAVAPEQKQARF